MRRKNLPHKSTKKSLNEADSAYYGFSCEYTTNHGANDGYKVIPKVYFSENKKKEEHAKLNMLFKKN
tara:strand:- start:243 stop:443 length:201 start_codon:yes stop_codon:yes gene_type:complete